jgi:MSHA biogenesis protein MshP
MKTGAPSDQRGFAAVAAIFLVVVLATLGAFMLTFSNTQQLTSAQDMQGTRAYWVARAGLEWGVNRVSAVNACPAAVNNLGAVEGFNLVVNCGLATYVENGVNRNIFRLTAQATAGNVGTIGYVERSLTAGVER